MPSPFALFVYSNPSKVSEDVWKEWYLKEHLRDMVYHKASRTGAFYQSSSHIITSREPPKDRSEDMKFLAIYQTAQAGTLKANWSNPLIRNTSKRWEEGLHHWDVGDLVRAEGNLIEVLGSYEHIEDVAQCIVLVKIIGEEAESKLQFEHVNSFSKLEGYRRTLSYRPVDQDDPQSPAYTLHNFDKASAAIMIHEFSSLDESSLSSVKTDLEKIEPTKDCSFQLRSFRLLDAEGFGDRARTPE